MPSPDLVRLAAHYRLSPGTTERRDPGSKGKVEALVRLAKSDLIPHEGFGSLDDANRAGAAWCREVNAEVHHETKARPAERLEAERPLLRALPAARPAVACGEGRKVDRLATVRFASARYSVPHRLVGQVVQVAASDRDVVVMHLGVPVAQHALLAPEGRKPARDVLGELLAKAETLGRNLEAAVEAVDRVGREVLPR